MENAKNLSEANTEAIWHECHFLTCSVLPIRVACNLHCPFCFSRSSISSIKGERKDWRHYNLNAYYEFAVSRGANRLVITGGGEPLLDPDSVIHIIKVGSRYFNEITCFTNGTYLTRSLANQLKDAGLTYLCFSRHSQDDTECKDLIGPTAPTLDQFFDATRDIKVRATCVMLRDYVAEQSQVWSYIEKLSRYGVLEFTFKHTYVAYPTSIFQSSPQNVWARAHSANERDPFTGMGVELARLPWGPVIRAIDCYQVCYYYEPTPQWEKSHRLCRSINLLSDGNAYASLEDTRSHLFRLPNC